MRQIPAGELASYLAWFRTLPLWLDLDGLRVVHACWDETHMAKISGPVTDEFLYEACSPNGSLFEPVEAILKGKEVKLPPGATFRGKDGHERSHTRVKWYEPPEGHTYRTYAMAGEPIESDLPLPEEVVQAAVPYPEEAKPVFVGHYWLKGSRPVLLRLVEGHSDPCPTNFVCQRYVRGAGRGRGVNHAARHQRLGKCLLDGAHDIRARHAVAQRRDGPCAAALRKKNHAACFPAAAW